MSSAYRDVGLALLLVAAIGGCGSRPPYWDTQVGATTSAGLSSGVALIDDADHRVVMITASAGQNLTAQSFAVGHNIATTATSTDGATLFVLSAGDVDSTGADGSPSLTTIRVAPPLVTSTSYAISQPCTSLAVDPMGHWAVAYKQTGFVENQNELVIFDLTAPPGAIGSSKPNPIKRTFQSFGGTPMQLTFTPPLLVDPALGPAANGMVNGDRRLLVIETDIDVSLFDLDHAFDPSPRPEITIPLISETNAQPPTPAGVAVDGFDPSSAADARLALRTSSGSVVYTFAFGPPGPTDINDFAPIVNQTDVGGVASDMAFVHADGGALRLAVLVPGSAAAILVEPDTGLTTSVALPQSYSNLSLVTSAVSAGVGSDVALLWNGADASGVALWTLGEAVVQPYFSIDVPGVSKPIRSVSDVPNSNLKVLEPSDGSGFFVLDLQSHQVSPLTTATAPTLSIAPDGGRIWAFAQGGTDLASIDLATLNPIPLTDTAPIDAVYDIAGPLVAGILTRDLVSLHIEGTVGATVFDALAPDKTPPRRIASLLLEGP
jgi:hypothetical protein